jgi:hypothetical protein
MLFCDFSEIKLVGTGPGNPPEKSCGQFFKQVFEPTGKKQCLAKVVVISYLPGLMNLPT